MSSTRDLCHCQIVRTKQHVLLQQEAAVLQDWRSAEERRRACFGLRGGQSQRSLRLQRHVLHVAPLARARLLQSRLLFRQHTKPMLKTTLLFMESNFCIENARTPKRHSRNTKGVAQSRCCHTPARKEGRGMQSRIITRAECGSSAKGKEGECGRCRDGRTSAVAMWPRPCVPGCSAAASAFISAFAPAATSAADSPSSSPTAISGRNQISQSNAFACFREKGSSSTSGGKLRTATEKLPPGLLSPEPQKDQRSSDL